MKISKYIYVLLLLCGLFFWSFQVAKAQREGAVTFTDGITIATTTEVKPPMAQNSGLGVVQGQTFSSSNGKDIVHRVMTDVKNKLYFGYDIEVSPMTDTNKFKVAFKPLSINPNRLAKVDNLTAFSFTKYPDEMIVNDGEIIFFDTLKNPETKVQLSDLIKVTRHGRTLGSFFPERKPAQDFTVNDVQLKLLKAEAFINDEKVGQVGGLAGSTLAFYFQGRGQFVFSLFPKKGVDLEKIGIIEDNKLTFSYQGDTYKFVSSTPIVETGGKWNVWVLYNPDYKPQSKSPYEFSAGDIDSLIGKRP